MRIDDLANRAAGAMGHCGGCILISDMGVLPAHSTLGECGVFDGTNLIAMMQDDDMRIIDKYFSRMLLRGFLKLPKRFSIDPLLRLGLLELSPGGDRVVSLRINGQDLPKEVGLLTELKALTLSMVSALPCEVGNLFCLEALTIEDSTIDQLPIELGQLRSLKRLRLVGLKNLRGLPGELDMLSELSMLEVVACPNLREIPRGVAQFADYLEIKVGQTGWVYDIPATPPWA